MALVLAAAGTVFGPSRTARAQSQDSAAIQITAEVVADMSVAAMNSPIALGQVFENSAQEIAADGSSSPLSTAGRFDITGANGLSWRLTVSYNNLTGPGAEVITIAAPAGNDICFNTTIGSQAPCTVTGNSPLTVPEASHAGDGSAWVGFQFSVPAVATSGAYSHASAMSLTAEGLLGT